MDEKHFTFIVTKSCQLSCKYCYLVGKNSNERMSFDVAKKFVDLILSSNFGSGEDCVYFDFIGGEPLLEIDLISNTCDYIEAQLRKLNHPWKNSHFFGITTNGILYNSPKCQKLISKYHSILEISISIDGTKRKNDLNRIFPDGRGSYDRIINNVKLWLRHFPNAITKMVISSEDLPYVYESALHLISLGLVRLDMNLVVENVWKEGDDVLFEAQLMQLADYIVENNLYDSLNLYIFENGIGHALTEGDALSPCRESYLSVDSSGTLYTCLRFASFSLRNKKYRSVGSIYSGINWNHLRAFNTIDNLSVTTVKCKSCNVASGCRWCPGENYDSSITNSIFDRAVAICNMHKARVRAKNYYINRIISKENGRIWKI